MSGSGRLDWLGCMIVLAVSLGGLGCEDSTGLDRDSDRLIQTEATEYDLQWDGLGLTVDIPYVFTNRTGGTVYLVNCNGGFGLHLERKANLGFRPAWWPVLRNCLSAPIVIENNDTFVDTLRVWGAPPGGNISPEFDVDDPSGTYRIVWDDALSSFNGYLYPFGEQIPIEARISNWFTLRKASGPAEGPPDFSGIVLEVRDQVSSFLMERTVRGRAVVHVSQTTRVYSRLSDGSLQLVGPMTVANGDSVEVWTTGVELRSLPPQYYGIQLVVW